WWFGGAVEKPELERELRAMKAAGIGGVEIQPVYPLELDDPQRKFRNQPYLSADFLSNVQFAASKAKELGLRVDITLGSGWPYGGPDTPVTQAAGRLRVDRVNVPEGARSAPLPAIENGEKLIAAFVGGEQARDVHSGRIELPAGLSGSDVLMFFISSRTGQQVKRASLGAEGFVLDHYDRAAIDKHLAAVGEPLLRAFGDTPPHSVFSDSLEVYGSDWTPDFLEEFQQRRGYDLTPHLPALVNEMGRQSQAVRHDWAKTLTELAEDNYLKPIRVWAHAHHTLFRSQTYGEPPVILSSNAQVDLPEGEHGPLWRRFSAARWASSASHLYGAPVTSTETWTWLHSPVFRATPLDMKAEADRHFIEGINQLIGHGWPYSPPSADEPGWRFYAAAAFNDHNPWFQVMPEITRYLQRVSFLLRQGQPVNHIAIYLPTDDAWSHLQPGKAAVDEMTDTLLGPVLIPEVLNAGYNFDFIDDRAMAKAGIPYKILILPGIERIPLETMQRLHDYAAKGGLLVATKSLPSLGPGLVEEKRDSGRIAAMSRELFETGSPRARLVEHEQGVSAVLKAMLPPDFYSGRAGPAIGFIHRKLATGEVYFIANASNRAIETEASVRVAGQQAEWWDPFSGEVEGAAYREDGGRTQVSLKLAPYESRLLVFCESCSKGLLAKSERAADLQSLDLASDWRATFTRTGRSIQMAHLRSWTSDEETRFYSGEAVYEKSLNLPAQFLAKGSKVFLDFGQGTAVEPSSSVNPGMHALLESPVRESAIVFVNGERAGTVWHPPYEIEVTRYLRPGMNALRVLVANLAINNMAGQPLPDYRLLDLRYGERFLPQDMQDVKPLPSGILGTVRLVKR
ncbi:MAG: glycoside hydrolase, partial [Acidobacteriota bacterium]|nr:glycoside hydrolase [Acidobacteriota bacterium]